MVKKIYMAGCGGMLGEAFYKIFSSNYLLKCSDIDVNDNWLSYLDFRDYDKYKKSVFEFKPDYLFHIGAFTDLEYCEKNPDNTKITNTDSVKHAVSIANDLDISILYISTAGIFDGSKDTFDESDQPNPIGHYAKSKYEAEVYVQNYSKKHLICRAGWMMGGGPKKDKKFIQKIIQQIKDGKKEIFVVDDKLGTPTYTIDFAKNVKLMIENNVFGLFNLVCEGLTSRLDVAKELISILRLEQDINIKSVNSSYFKKEYFAERPSSERLINTKIKSMNLHIMRDWRHCLNEYINEYYKDYIK
tara:strand:- start:1 stop:903 length:903 start_codon:yes stop_codon:yes gene_type:complete